MAKLFLFIAALNGLIAVALGALGAHALKPRLDEAALQTLQTGLHYHGLHALALLAVASLALHWPGNRWLLGSGSLFTLGMLLFCGSLYLLAITTLRQIGPLPVGLLTPLGGLCFITGWLLLAAAAWQSGNPPH